LIESYYKIILPTRASAAETNAETHYGRRSKPSRALIEQENIKEHKIIMLAGSPASA